MDTKHVLTDCDGVLLNWEYAFITHMKAKNYEILQPMYKYGFDHDTPVEEVDEEIIKFNASAAIGFLPPLRDAVEYVTKLSEKGYRFTVISSFSTDEFARLLRIRNLEKIFGKIFDNYQFLGCDESKISTLTQYKDSGAWWIEDKMQNAIDGSNLGLRSVLLEHRHNMIRDDSPSTKLWKEAEDIPRAKDWRQIYDMIVGET